MRIRQRVLWGLWIACLVFSLCFIVWFFTEVVRLYLEAESW